MSHQVFDNISTVGGNFLFFTSTRHIRRCSDTLKPIWFVYLMFGGAYWVTILLELNAVSDLILATQQRHILYATSGAIRLSAIG